MMLTLTRLVFDASGFSWVLDSDRMAVVQTGYRVQVACDAAFDEIFWDSGDVESGDSIHVAYGGAEMPCSSVLYWRAMAVDNHGDKSGWATGKPIITGIKSWTATFVSAETDDDAMHSAGKMLRKDFILNGGIKQAVVHVTALGIYELSLNGQVVGDAVLAPGWTEYDKRLLYQSWDVTALLNDGENTVGAMVAPGWYKGDLGWQSLRDGKGLRNVYGKRTALLMQLEVQYNNGSKETITTGEGWKYADGPVKFSEIYHGEMYDARLEQCGWNKPNFNDAHWKTAEILDRSTSSVVPQDGAIVRRQEMLSAKAFIITPKGERVINFGQNISGWVRFTVSGNAGDIVKLRHAEVLDSAGNFYTENLRRARNEIVYTLKGVGEETFEPHFTFQGFQYVCVDVYPGEINIEHFKAVVIHSDMPRMGTFASSHKLLNQLHANILWGLKGNFVDIPTDCPQRDERMGWTGDAQVFVRTSAYLMDTKAFFRKWLRDLRAAQFENGGVPMVVPDVLTGYFGDGDVIAQSGAVTGWGDAAVICPWVIYQAYGDVSILEENFTAMKAWVEFIRNRSTDGLLWNTDYQLGDWVALDAKEGSYFGATATDLIATAYYAKCAEIVAKTAALLGHTDDKNNYTTLHNHIKTAYRDEFFSKTGRLVSPTQTAHILSLAFGLTPPEYVKRVTNDLLGLLKDNGGHLTTGFLGTPYFCQVLADNGCLNAAYELLLLEDYPSWLYQVTKGATTVWEHWDGIKPDGTMWSANMNSFNHYAYGSVGEFIYRVIAGIDTDEKHPGYKKMVIAPRPGGGISFAKTSLMTPYGEAATDWHVDGGKFVLNVTVPHNATAGVTLPDGVNYEVGSGVHEFICDM